MFEIIEYNDNERWDRALSALSESEKDVYYLRGYTEAFRLVGDGTPCLLHFTCEGNEAVCAMMLRDLAEDSNFVDKIVKGTFYDMITPYGYGGFIFKNEPTANNLKELKTQLYDSLEQHNIVSAFFRFHPIMNNADYHNEVMSVVNLGPTVAFDLSGEEVIWNNLIGKCRTKIRKAEKLGVEIHHGKDLALFDRFKEIYDETMSRDNASDYYFFPKEFYNSVHSDLYDKYEMFYAEFEGRIIAMSIMLFEGNCMNYHLSGSLTEYRNIPATNLLLYKAALWGAEHGYKTLHLGGGVGAGEDNLYKFKAAFNRNSDYQFSIGKMIVNDEKYDYLMSLRGFGDNEKKTIGFFPQYRATIEVNE